MNLSDLIQKHERLFLGIAALFVVLWLGNAWINHVAADKKEQANNDQKTLQVQADANSTLQKIIDQQKQQFDALVKVLDAQNSQLLSSINSRNTETKKQQSVDATLNLTETASRMQHLVPGLLPRDVQIMNDSLSLSLAGARGIVSQLEFVPVLQANLEDGKKILANKDEQINGLENVRDKFQQQVEGLNQQITDANKACTSQVAAIKADARKGKVKWFKIGFVTGYVSGLVTHILVTH